MTMTLRDEIGDLKIREIIKAEKEFEFPEFIRCLRKTRGISRKTMASELGIDHMKIYYKEAGKFSRMPETEFLVAISQYLGVSKGLLISKARSFVEKK